MTLYLSPPMIGNYPITQTFAEHVEFKATLQLQYYNGGIDYGAPNGTPIYAAAAGKVSVAGGDNTGYGLHVRVLHPDNYLTVYAHCSTLVSQAGDTVISGQMIARVGSTGNSTGTHLHFELRRGNTPIDPQPFLDALPDPTPTIDPVNHDAPVIPGPLPRAKVIVKSLRMRQGPGVAFPTVGSLIKGNDPEIIQVKETIDGTWVQLGWQQWAAYEYDGERMMLWL